MPQFDYKARQKSGPITTGTLEATDRRAAVQRLQQDGLHPVTVTEAKRKGFSLGQWVNKAKALQSPAKTNDEANLGKPISGGTPKREKVGFNFLKRLLELHNSGLPIGDSIRILSQRLSDPEQKALANQLWRDLSEGATLAGALNRQPKYFSGSVSYVIEAGEATGSLAPILRKVIDYLEEKQAIRKKMIASMAYPSLICSVALVVVVIFLTVLLPQIQGMLDQLGGEMTMSAKILIGGADFLIAYGPYAIALVVIGAIAFERWRKTDKGLSTTDRWLLKFPLLGKIILLSDLFQSGNLVSTLLESGINTTETLRLTERTIKNTELRERFHNARGQINEGLGISQAFKRNEFMPDLSLDILAVGENTGNLAHSMDEVTRGFRDELTKRLTGLTAMVSTAALVTAFLMVALIAMGIITSVMAVSRELSM